MDASCSHLWSQKALLYSIPLDMIHHLRSLPQNQHLDHCLLCFKLGDGGLLQQMQVYTILLDLDTAGKSSSLPGFQETGYVISGSV